MASVVTTPVRSWSQDLGSLENVEIEGKRVRTLTRAASSRGCVIAVPELTESNPRVTLRLDQFTSEFAFGVRRDDYSRCRYFVATDKVAKTMVDTSTMEAFSTPLAPVCTENVFKEAIEQKSELSVSFDRGNGTVTFEYNGKKHSEEWKATESRKVHACLWTFRPFVAVSLMADASADKAAVASGSALPIWDWRTKEERVAAYYCAKCSGFNEMGTEHCVICGAVATVSSAALGGDRPVAASVSTPKWQTAEWKCAKCTFLNRRGTQRCHACTALPPTALR